MAGGSHIAAEKARLDFAWDGIISAAFPTLRGEPERLVRDDLLIASYYLDEATERRAWCIDGFAEVPCGGTRLRRTSEVGEVELKREDPGRSRERIEIRLADPWLGL